MCCRNPYTLNQRAHFVDERVFLFAGERHSNVEALGRVGKVDWDLLHVLGASTDLNVPNPALGASRVPWVHSSGAQPFPCSL
jgi:hypothetical protein